MFIFSASYQSYQTGIETQQRHICLAVFQAINRTKLELKQLINSAQGCRIDNYQSYQTGIETNWIYLLLPAVFYYQSYQTGIETSFSEVVISWIWSYQSYQTGIETKLNIMEFIAKNNLSIVPNWNWNKTGTGRISLLPAINRTKLELKRSSMRSA